MLRNCLTVILFYIWATKVPGLPKNNSLHATSLIPCPPSKLDNSLFLSPDYSVSVSAQDGITPVSYLFLIFAVWSIISIYKLKIADLLFQWTHQGETSSMENVLLNQLIVWGQQTMKLLLTLKQMRKDGHHLHRSLLYSWDRVMCLVLWHMSCNYALAASPHWVPHLLKQLHIIWYSLILVNAQLWEW